MIGINKINGFSKQGIRENNEDYILFNKCNDQDPKSKIIILCDGMGGHGHGEIASKTVAEAVYQFLQNECNTEYTKDDLQQALNSALVKLNEAEIFNEERKMGTTLVVVVINKMNILVGHVGDSRCYLMDSNSIIKFRTRDHSKVAEAVEAEILTEEEAKNSEYKNILTRCVIAGKENVQIEVDELTIEDGDRLLLCSDGVVDALDDNMLQELMMGRELDECLNVIDRKCADSSRDNYSLIIADLSQDEENKVIVRESHKENVPQQADGSYVLCKRCGSRLEKDSKYCPACGASQLLDQQMYTTPENKGKRKQKKIVISLVVVLVIIFLAIISFRIINKFQERKVYKENVEEFTIKYKSKNNDYNVMINELLDSICTTDKNSKDSLINKKVLKFKIDSIKKISNSVKPNK